MRADEISARKLSALAQASNGERKRSVQPRKARGQRAQTDGRARGEIKKIKHMKRIRLDKRRKRVNVDGFEMENEVVYNYFAGLPEREREEKFFKAIYIGVLALMEDRLSAFLAKTSNELGTELESLKMIFDKLVQSGTGNQCLYAVNALQKIILPAAVQLRQNIIQQ